ncbi:uncharacterized protein CC84DRAFT_975729 [Paraphaeosphaeria sporulosa]|uniref:C2H2-type domain-containing protein n=1 Tax=Paraphaeosphaeria sporulosa TaxID=1460663 RepID=A0A177C4Z3_9PLEO|nr:uncharacterized protein CC84DRAFT_975729 [Paraphaeosphaeria sporulosa]OAG01949.1 hypothetical protein CC84DRAFT_975729 [Paraphaeosphaeria sporulosa]
MYTLLVVAVVLALLFDTAAASSPVMDPTMSAPFGSLYPDPDGILSNLCELCAMPMGACLHTIASYQVQQTPPFAVEPFYEHLEWPNNDPYAVSAPITDHMPVDMPFSYPYAEEARQPLVNEIVRRLENDATTVNPNTVLKHVEDTYTPGDRTAETTSRRPGHKRQQPRPCGFPCVYEGCGRTFDRSCDLKRHQKTHLIRSERPHKCSYCKEGFLYPKDRNRHERTHDESTASQNQLFRCPVPGCPNVGFSRRDNLLRHQRKQHPHMGMSSPQMSP